MDTTDDHRGIQLTRMVITNDMLTLDGDLKTRQSPTASRLAVGWSNLTFIRRPSPFFGGQPRTILDRLRGRIDFGTITALMGPSGAGKTTLLRCINGIGRANCTEDTEIIVNKATLIRPCYVVQDTKEHLMMRLTPRESLWYSSALKNRPAGRDVDHKSIVEQILEDLMLTECADTLNCLCSGGEQKRLAIGLELTALLKPNLICVDEPTSGLDSTAAEQTIACLQRLARNQHSSLVVSIHQPSADILVMFDQLYVLARAGVCVYSGPSKSLKDHLTNSGVAIKHWQVPIEVLIKFASASRENGMTEEVHRLAKKTIQEQASLDETLKSDGRRLNGGFVDHKKRFHPLDFLLLLKRELHHSWLREWRIHLIQTLLLITTIIYFIYLFPANIGQDPDCPVEVNVENITAINERVLNVLIGNQSDAEINVKFIFMALLFIVYIYMMSVSLVFPSQVKLFLNEHRNRWYSTGSYYWSKVVAQLPLVVAVSYVYFWIAYVGSAQPDLEHWSQGVWDVPTRFKLFQLFALLMIVSNLAMSMTISIVFSDFRSSLIAMIAAYLMMLFFTGLYFPIKALDPVLQTLVHPNYCRLAFNSLMEIVYGDRCLTQSLVLIRFAVDENQLWSNFNWLWGQAVFWFLIGLVAMVVKSNRNRIADWLSNRRKQKTQTQAINKTNFGHREQLNLAYQP